jgi:hypothetical protein
MYIVERFVRGEGTSFVARCANRAEAFAAVREDVERFYGRRMSVEGVHASMRPRYDGCVASYHVVGREVWYNVYLAEVLNG